jgi:serine phosphatase RsbU (regulator of sigma subunit)/predicted ester cyclase
MMPTDTMDAAAFVRELQQAANAHDASRLGEFYAEDAVAVSPVFGEVKGRREVVRTFETLFETFPDCVFDLSDVFAEGNRFAFLGTVTATDKNGWFGLPPTGVVVRYRITMVCTVAGEKIVREERLYDLTGVVERLEKARIDAELQTASEVQSALLPRSVKTGTRWEAVADSIPCRAIGGDFFEIVELPSGAVGVALGDVEGKGTPAALVGAMLHGMFVADAQTGLNPAATLQRMNRQLAVQHTGNKKLATRHRGTRFATLVYGVLSPDGRFVYSNAGHSPPALLTRGEVRRLRSGGPILGAFPDASFEEGGARLATGDTLLMFSDGVTEARNANDEEFGEARLIAHTEEHVARSPAEFLDGILGALREFVGPTHQSDDITVAVTRYR